MKVMLTGSSWTVGAWKKSNIPYSDDLDYPGVPELLKQFHDVTNVSEPAAFNIGIYNTARDKNPEDYDIILACQNDVLKDFSWKHGQNTDWRQFLELPDTDPINGKVLVSQGISDLHKLIGWLLNEFYRKLSSLNKPVILFAGPSKLDNELARYYGIHPIQPDWCSLLVPEYQPSFVESKMYLGWATELLMHLFPTNKTKIKEQCLELLDQVNARLNLYKSYPEFFAYHHPTVQGNLPMGNLLNRTLHDFIQE